MDNRSISKWKIRCKGGIRHKINLFCVTLFIIIAAQGYALQNKTPQDVIYLNDSSLLKGKILRMNTNEIFLLTEHGKLRISRDKIEKIVVAKNITTNIRFGQSKQRIKDSDHEISNLQEKILDQAFALLGKKPNSTVIVKNKKFKLDCVGTVSAIFYSVGIDITKDFRKYRGNGVSRIYHSLKDKVSVYTDKWPKVGDIIFWENTWDRNNDGIIGNDPFTHAGIVVKVDDDGTIHYIHENYFLGVVVERMNLYKPNVYKDISGKIINSPMYTGSSIRNHPEKWLSGDLWKEFGGVIKVKEYY